MLNNEMFSPSLLDGRNFCNFRISFFFTKLFNNETNQKLMDMCISDLATNSTNQGEHERGWSDQTW